jgi:predicted XRE-type DNA-binding protein
MAKFDDLVKRRTTKKTQAKAASRAAELLTELFLTESSGNVFADLGIKDADAYLAKSALAIHIHSVIKKRRLTKEEAGQILGISQPKVSAILKGRLDGFSTERLFRFLNVLGRDA